MKRRLCAPAVLILTLGIAGPGATVAAAERWTCDIDLHQGDTGTLRLDVTGTAVEGTMTVTRGAGAPPATTTVKGSWAGEVVRFTRVLSATSEQPFLGIAARAEQHPVKMAGRFAFQFEGVWSASCSPEGGGAGPGRGRGPVPPTPPPGRGGPPGRPAASCSISGAATGPRAELAKVFRLTLYGPDNDKLLRAQQPFGRGAFTFRNLPDGEYVIVPDTRADVAVTLTPRRHVVHCRGGAVTGRNFEFR